MRKKFFIPLLIAIAIAAGYLIKEVIATPNPHTWTDGLVAYWSFDGQYTTSTSGTADVSGNNNWTNFFGGPTPVAGISGQAMSFDGVNDHASTTNGSIDISAANTFEVWVKVLSNPASSPYFRPILGKSSSYLRGLYWVQGGYSVGIYFMADSEDSTKFVNFNYTPSNDWIHVVGVWTGTRTKIYKNGVLQETSNANDTWTHSAGNYNMGNSPDGTRFVNIVLDEARIYNRALSDSEVMQHYNQTKRNMSLNNPSGNPPIAWWKMDEPTGQKVKDWSGANDGTVSSGGYGVTSTDGKIGKALDFDGENDFVSIPASQTFAMANMTISAWINADDFAQWRGLLKIYENDTSDYFVIRNNGTAFQLLIENDNQSQINLATPAPETNKWIHVAFTQDGSSWKYYKDGITQTLTGTNGATSTSHLTVNNVRIGFSGWALENFNGLIDDMRIYNYARTAQQIAEDYQAGAYRTKISTANSADWSDGLVGYWSFDGQYTTSTDGTADVSGNNNWGAFSGGVSPVGGVAGQAMRFDGSNDFVNVGTGSGLNMDTNDFTVEFWAKALGGTNGRGIVNKGGWSSTGYFFSEAYSPANTYYFGVRDSAGYKPISFATEVWGWSHIVGIKTTNHIEVWVNGVRANQWDGTIGSLSNPSKAFEIGRSFDPDYFNGLIDEVRVYNRALSADEIREHYSKTRRNLKL